MNKTLIVSILLIAIILTPTALSASKPSWVAPGKYAEYEVKVSGFSETGSLRWEIKEVHDTYAMVEISMRIPFTGESTSSTEKWTYGENLGGDLAIDPSRLNGMNLPVEYKTVPAGTFKCYKYTYANGYTAWYDTSTGILVAMETTLLGLSATLELKSTNIMGFPWLWIIIGVLVVIAVVFIALRAIKRKIATIASTPSPTPETLPQTPPPSS